MSTSYNKQIYGNAVTTPAETLAKLEKEKCFVNGKLMIYPDWFKAAEMFELIGSGLVSTKNYGKRTYGHMDIIHK